MIEISNPKLLEIAQHLPLTGRLLLSDTHLVYLAISDDYIHQLYNLLENINNIEKPDYFHKYPIGAHITVFYPDENVTLQPTDLNQVYYFKIKSLGKMQIGIKTYYALKIESPELISLRKKYGLSEKLNFRGYKVDLHITIGVSKN